MVRLDILVPCLTLLLLHYDVGGVRIPQFIHYPNGISSGTTLDVPVSTIDIAATMLDIAGISPTYDIDGKSWKDVINSDEEKTYWGENRCLFFETQKDRAARCGCFKYLDIFAQDSSVSTTFDRGTNKLLSTDLTNLFDLCDGSTEYITDNANNREAANLIADYSTQVRILKLDNLMLFRDDT